LDEKSSALYNEEESFSIKELYMVIYYVIVNIIGLLIMREDKKRAKQHAWRISEKTLFLIALLGGALGGIIGMYTYRHKTKHPSFKIGFPLFMLLHIAFIYIILK
jgi:uncharacterized membrane protein YsdA (DUF1294 family)